MSKQKGFTLIELLVTVSIMVILTSLIIANFGYQSRNRAIQNAKSTLVSDLRRAQSSSLSSKDAATNIPSFDYGIVINLDTNAKQYSVVSDDKNGIRRVVNTVTLPDETTFSNISIQKTNSTTIQPRSIELMFRVPYARAYVTYPGTTGERDDVTVLTLRSKDGSSTGQIQVNGLTGNISK